MGNIGKNRCILISGAGIAGLSAALELASRGWRIRIFEKAPVLSEVGAGLQLAPNAMRHLQRLGVAAALEPFSVTPENISLVDGRSARPLLTMGPNDITLARWKYPYQVCHRADLQSALVETVGKNPAIELNLGAEVLSHKNSQERVTAIIKRNSETESVEGDYLLGCDGVWSTLRQRAGYDPARFSGYTAWRNTIPASALPSSFLNALPQQNAVSAWLGKNAHFIAYPVKAGEAFNFVAIIAGDNTGETWSTSGDSQTLINTFKDWSTPVREVISTAVKWTYWPLFEMANARFIADARTILLGDAAHALTPFAAQGAAMAIEDAAALAVALDQPNPTLALQHFETVRKARIDAAAKRGRMNRFAYHASGPFAMGRNLLFANRPAENFLKDLDWLYGYDAIGAMQAR
ncbi:FAD-binding protein [Falsochrobactrum ovis]|uniref:Salicylate hydroxylase n=1 Tax=Falsochrobactrum ovis TaxID=1293442 RepID=A0A364JVH6_9HYPH|nr:FAD-binding protein [Falsochrobactrum ovis]RAK29058.1 salicylate hydroxylase [Falsochrobactrum ovis]